jgi:hypothetical protein
MLTGYEKLESNYLASSKEPGKHVRPPLPSWKKKDEILLFYN